MFFKKKKKVTWRKRGEYFYVLINGKEISDSIPNFWTGNDLVVFIADLNKYFLLLGYSFAPDNEEYDAQFLAEGFEILWQKVDDGYYLYENGKEVQNTSTPYWIEDIFMVAYQDKDYLLKDYQNLEENKIYQAVLINDEMQVSWIKIQGHFYLIANTTLTLNHEGHFCQDDLLVYVDDLEAIMMLSNYRNCDEYVFYEATRAAEKNQFLYRKGSDGFYLYFNEKPLHQNSRASYVLHDILVYLPDFNLTLRFPDYRNEAQGNYCIAEVLETGKNTFWCANENGFYLIDKGRNFSAEIGSHTSRIGNHLLVHHPPSTTTYLFQNYLNLKDGAVRPAVVLSYTADFVWAADENNYYLWYKGQRVGECEHQLIGNDLMVMPKSLKILVQLKDFVNCRDYQLRPVESQ